MGRQSSNEIANAESRTDSSELTDPNERQSMKVPGKLKLNGIDGATGD